WLPPTNNLRNMGYCLALVLIVMRPPQPWAIYLVLDAYTAIRLLLLWGLSVPLYLLRLQYCSPLPLGLVAAIVAYHGYYYSSTNVSSQAVYVDPLDGASGPMVWHNPLVVATRSTMLSPRVTTTKNSIDNTTKIIGKNDFA
ncbi:hypothetical protein U1Q18_011148, partial [Sarracenia purpurea var. burkii]